MNESKLPQLDGPRPNSSATPTSGPRSTPSWQRPTGVAPGNWDYVRSGDIATHYDQFLKNDPLTLADGRVLDHYLPSLDLDPDGGQIALRSEPRRRPLVADFGCGNGRSLLPALARGYDGLGIDLSTPMLSTFSEKYHACQSNTSDQATLGRLALVQANLVDLDGLSEDSIDFGLCLFSTLGMVDGRENRRQFLKHVRRLLKPGGTFIVHAHNVWFQAKAPGGWRWLASSLWQQWTGQGELGDRVADYRGLKNLFIHSYRRRELAADLQFAKLIPDRWYGVLPGATELAHPLPWLGSLRVVGWVVACR